MDQSKCLLLLRLNGVTAVPNINRKREKEKKTSERDRESCQLWDGDCAIIRFSTNLCFIPLYRYADITNANAILHTTENLTLSRYSRGKHRFNLNISRWIATFLISFYLVHAISDRLFNRGI